MRIILIICLLFLSLAAYTEEPDKKPRTDAMLFGDVKAGNEHIPFATITIHGTTIGTAADATGHFKITNLPLGKQKILVSAVGYKPYSKEIIFSKNNSITLLV